MKYIRTKCNIFEVIEETDLVYRVIGASREKNNVYSKSKCQTEVIKQANTIEELSDCFIAVDKNGNLCENPMIAKGHCFKSFCNYYKANGIDVDCYLAILTDKGLIYVAKMNKEGELVLL